MLGHRGERRAPAPAAHGLVSTDGISHMRVEPEHAPGPQAHFSLQLAAYTSRGTRIFNSAPSQLSSLTGGNEPGLTVSLEVGKERGPKLMLHELSSK